MDRVLRLLALALMVFMASAPTGAAEDAPRQAIDAARSALADIDNALKSDNLSDSDLARLRAVNDPLAIKIQAVVTDLTPRLEASRKRLAELKPQSKDAQVAPDPASAELKDEQAKFTDLDADLRSAKALLLQADDNSSRIGAARRELFARQTFARSSSVFSPALWLALAAEAPHDASSIALVASDWALGLTQRLTQTQALGFLAFVLGLVAISAPMRWLATRVIARDPETLSPTRLRRALAAAWTILVLIALPLAALAATAYALDYFDISDPRMQPGFDAILDGLRLVAIAYAFGRGLFAPGEPNWRVFALGDRSASILFRFLIIAAAIWSFEKLLEAIAEETASLNISIASRGFAALLIGLVAVVTMRRVVDRKLVAQPTKDVWAPARLLAWIYIAILLGAAVTGYIAFAAFLINQTLFVFVVGGALYLADVIVQQSAEEFLKPDAALGRSLMTIIGLRREKVEQVVVIAQAFARIAVIGAALVVAFGPLGLPAQQDLSATLRAAYFGFTIGGITISLSSLIASVVIFVLVLLATRAVQNWLTDRYLPRTSIDAGVGNSVRTIIGYIGLVLALLIGGARLGLDLEKFGLIAGALSVGIGFGLQGIANNFVSGLILLMERGIQVGDWIVVGVEQGFVRKINARSTEIETFDRATLIVPNSTLVTGTVKNWLHSDRIGRIVIWLNVEFGSDPEGVRELMIAAAKSQEAVLTIPAPVALFSEIGDWALRFQLVCFVEDALMGERIRSEINFDLHRRILAAGIGLARPYAAPKS